MKIYFIGQKGMPAKFGGVERHVEELSARLANMGHDVFVYVRGNYVDSDLLKYKGVNLIELPSIGTKHLDAISHTFFACLDMIRRKADIIHFHSIGPSSLIWLIKILKPGVPVIFTFHTQCYVHKKWGLLAKTYLQLSERLACFFADKIITISKSLTKYTKNKYNIDSKYIPNGVGDMENIPASAIKKWGLKKDNYILSVSRLVRHKGIHYLIDAYKKIETDKKLVIVGDGAFTDDYVKELKEQAGENVNIIFTDNQTGEVLQELFSNAYIFVQPSESEGLSIALLEAMAYGLAPLVSNIPENMEAIGEIGFSFENKNSNSLANKLSFLIDHPEKVNDVGRISRSHIANNYHWDNIANETDVFYRNVALDYLVKNKRLVKKFISFIF